MDKKLITAILSCVIISSCSHYPSVQYLKDNSEQTDEFIISENYQIVYKNILNNMNNCIANKWAGMQYSSIVDHELYSEIKYAEVTFTKIGGGHKFHLSHVNVNGIGTSETKVNAYISGREIDDIKIIQKWSLKSGANCSL